MSRDSEDTDVDVGALRWTLCATLTLSNSAGKIASRFGATS
jgi:hypothetical protein